MAVQFVQTQRPVSNEELNAVEQRLNIIFPSEYRQHLLQHNGGHPEPSVYDFVENGERTSSDVSWFLAVYDGKYENFEGTFKAYKLTRQRMPNELVPIASDSGGNKICMAFSGPEKGKIFYWNHDSEADDGEEPGYRNVYPIADSFQGFLDCLHRPAD